VYIHPVISSIGTSRRRKATEIMSKGTPPRAIRIEDELWEQAKAVAVRRSDTISDVIRGALWSYIAEAPKHRADIQPDAIRKALLMGIFEAITTVKVQLHRADMETHGQEFEPGLSVTAVPVGAQHWHLTAAADGAVWAGLASSEDIEGVTLLATVNGNTMPQPPRIETQPQRQEAQTRQGPPYSLEPKGSRGLCAEDEHRHR
jgi:hypothetical protein